MSIVFACAASHAPGMTAWTEAAPKEQAENFLGSYRKLGAAPAARRALDRLLSRRRLRSDVFRRAAARSRDLPAPAFFESRFRGADRAGDHQHADPADADGEALLC